MRKLNKVNVIIPLVLMLLVMSFSTTTIYGFWADPLSGDNSSNSNSSMIGSWYFEPYSPDGIHYYNPSQAYSNGDLVYYEGAIWVYHGSYALDEIPNHINDWTVYNDYNWYPEVTYYSGDVVYYQENIYVSEWQQSGQNPVTTGVNGPWTNEVTDTLSWTTGQASSLNDVVYYEGNLYIYKGYYTTSEPGSQSDWGILGDLTYNSNFVYDDGDIVVYNGIYYSTSNGGWASGSVPGTNNAWYVLSTPTFNGSVPQNATYTIYNGLLYKSLIGKIKNSNRYIVPGSASSKGIWQAVNTNLWQQYNTYVSGDLVMYDGGVFELANVANSSDIPGTTANSWNGMATIYYNSLNTYQTGEYVIHNSEIYVVVNAINANQYEPGTFANAWNRLTTQDWLWYNTYQTGDVVFYNGVVYEAQNINTNQDPTSSSSWAYYQV